MTKFWSIRWKLGVLVAAVAFMLSALDMWLIPSRVATGEEEELRERASVLSHVLAGPMAVALDLEQPAETLTETLRTGLNDRLVRWAVVYDVSGKRLAFAGDGANPPSLVELQRWPAAGVIIGTSEVKPGNAPAPLGTVAVALASERIGERRSASQKAMAIQASIIVGIGVLLALLLSNRMARSMGRITQAARQITRGDVSGGIL